MDAEAKPKAKPTRFVPNLQKCACVCCGSFSTFIIQQTHEEPYWDIFRILVGFMSMIGYCAVGVVILIFLFHRVGRWCDDYTWRHDTDRVLDVDFDDIDGVGHPHAK